jgi:hypothetical protein
MNVCFIYSPFLHYQSFSPLYQIPFMVLCQEIMRANEVGDIILHADRSHVATRTLPAESKFKLHHLWRVDSPISKSIVWTCNLKDPHDADIGLRTPHKDRKFTIILKT